MPKKKKRTIYRDAETGEFTTKEDADARPKETVKEKVDMPSVEQIAEVIGENMEAIR